MSTHAAAIVPREINAHEVDHFRDCGWVNLERLISPDDAAALLARLKDKMGDEGLAGEHPAHGNAGIRDNWRVFAPLSVDLVSGEVRDSLFCSFSHSPALGRAGEALLGEPVRYWLDQALVKMPEGVEGSGETGWHCDIGSRNDSPFDPAIQANMWIALAEVTPEHGAMRFISPQDATDEVQAAIAGRPVDETYPELEERGILSPPLHLQPGDATVHASRTFHSSPPNRMSTPRWAYFVSVFPAAARYSGTPYWPMEGVDVEAGATFPDFRFPVLG